MRLLLSSINLAINYWVQSNQSGLFFSVAWRSILESFSNYTHAADLTPLPEHSRIIFGLSALARMSFVKLFLFPIGCLSILNSNQIFSSLVHGRMWRSYRYTKKMRFTTGSTENQLAYFAKILRKYVHQCSSHSIFGNM